ncbi:MAG: diaminopimelate epimerase [Deltaproteobacteria bacterium]|nr:diaminopimelate epimerase [Deltaproteobacteria bacterium]
MSLSVRFAKYHGLGNDFVLIDGRADGRLIDAHLAVRLCDRHRGVGADGVLSLLPSRHPDAIARMHLFNADGSVAEMCGNGLRCVVQALVARGAPAKMVIDTDAGLRRGERLGDGQVRASLGQPAVIGARSIEVAGRRFEGLAISVGNPHFVLQPFGPEEDLTSLALRYGPEIERHPAFPERTNVELLKRHGDRIEVVVFERGAGLTLACGTGAGAAAVAARELGLVAASGPATIRLPGGELCVDAWDGEVALVGEALHVFDGEIDPSAMAG